MLKLIGWVIAIIFVVSFFTVSDEDSSSTAEYSANQVVNVREGPSTDHEVVGQLTPGDTVNVEPMDDSDWARLSLDGETAYVYTPVLEEGAHQEPCEIGEPCWFDESEGQRALGRCRRAVEDMARFGYEWTHGWTQRRFSRVSYSPEEGVIALMGDRIELENAFGASSQHTYLCEFDPERGEVVDVSIAEGRL